MLGILPLTSFILALRSELVAKLVISVILSSIFFTWALYAYFIISFLLDHLVYLNQKKQVVI